AATSGVIPSPPICSPPSEAWAAPMSAKDRGFFLDGLLQLVVRVPWGRWIAVSQHGERPVLRCFDDPETIHGSLEALRVSLTTLDVSPQRGGRRPQPPGRVICQALDVRPYARPLALLVDRQHLLGASPDVGRERFGVLREDREGKAHVAAQVASHIAE